MQREDKYIGCVTIFVLPYRVFVDVGTYNFNIDGKKQSIDIIDHPKQSVQSQISTNLAMHKHQQIYLDSYGLTGITEIYATKYFEKKMNDDNVWELICDKKEDFSFSKMLSFVNRFISIYRAKTNEFWFRPISEKDLFSHSTFLLEEGKPTSEVGNTIMHRNLANGTPFLKTERWYEDLFHRMNSNWSPPFFLELFFEGEDALSRNNYKLAVAHFCLSFESIFRSLILEFFPKSGVDRKPIEQMMNFYFNKYIEIGDPKNIPIKKSVANSLFGIIWKNRDNILHGHDIEIGKAETENVKNSLKSLFALWFFRPGVNDDILIEGPFCGNTISNDPLVWLERAVCRYNGGHLLDAIHATEFALLFDRKNEKVRSYLEFLKS